jgi:hypothetical protein
MNTVRTRFGYKDLLALQVIIVVAFAFIKKRVHVAPNCCNGRPGIPVYVAKYHVHRHFHRHFHQEKSFRPVLKIA